MSPVDSSDRVAGGLACIVGKQTEAFIACYLTAEHRHRPVGVVGCRQQAQVSLANVPEPSRFSCNRLTTDRFHNHSPRNRCSPPASAADINVPRRNLRFLMPSRYPRIQRASGVLFVALGIALFVSGFAYDAYLTKNRPTKPTSNTGEVISIDKGNPHHYVTSDEYLLLGMPFGVGVLFLMLGGRLIKESK